jgi:hypothetical protein
MKSAKLMIAVALLVLAVPAIAQTATIRATLPFAFNVGRQFLAAGEYRVIVDSNTLRVAPPDAQGINCGSFSYISAGPSQDVSPKLVFHRYGNTYFLAEVWTGDTTRGHKLSISRAERHYARTTKPESTTVIATLLPN